MGKSPREYSFKVTPTFLFIKDQAERTGCYIHHDQAKETLQLFLNNESFTNGERYIGAIQYEGSNHYEKMEPHLVSWRFKRENLPNELRQELEAIGTFRKDKNNGPAINPDAESIAFKFEELNELAKETISEIAEVLRMYK